MQRKSRGRERTGLYRDLTGAGAPSSPGSRGPLPVVLPLLGLFVWTR